MKTPPSKLADRPGLETLLGHVENTARPRILVVGETPQMRVVGSLLKSRYPVIHAGLAEISESFLASTVPDIVVSSLATPCFDCLDLAHRLHEVGFMGRYRILTDDLPDRRVLMHEIHSACPGLDAAVLSTAHLKSRFLN